MGSVCGGDNLGKMAKNCMKITKSTFLGQNSGRPGGQANFFGCGRIPSVPPPLGEILGIKGTNVIKGVIATQPQPLSLL